MTEESVREVTQGPQEQGDDEEIPWGMDVSGVGDDPTDVVVSVEDLNTGEDVTDDVTSGSASIDGNLITLPTIQDLTADHWYRIQVLFNIGSAKVSGIIRLKAKE